MPNIITESQKQLERVHTLLHVHKSAGKISAHLEPVDHGNAGNPSAAKREIGKLLLDVMRLAVAFDLTAEELEQMIAAWEQQRS